MMASDEKVKRGQWVPVRCPLCGDESEVLGETATLWHVTCPKRGVKKAAPAYVPTGGKKK